MKSTLLRLAGLLALCLCLPVSAQIETTPLEQAPEPLHERSSPPVLPEHPLRRAISAIANGGSGGMSYSGPAGAMNTSPEGSSCAVVCALRPREAYSIECPSGNTAFCQCDVLPYADCRVQ